MQESLQPGLEAVQDGNKPGYFTLYAKPDDYWKNSYSLFRIFMLDFILNSHLLYKIKSILLTEVEKTQIIMLGNNK